MSHYSELIHKSMRLASRNLVVSVASGLPIDEEKTSDSDGNRILNKDGNSFNIKIKASRIPMILDRNAEDVSDVEIVVIEDVINVEEEIKKSTKAISA